MADKKISAASTKASLATTDLVPVAAPGDTTAYHVTGETVFSSWVGTLDTPQWNDINFAGANLGVGAAAPDLITAFGSGSILLRAFAGVATTEQLFSSDEMLHGYAEGTDITFHVHWMATDGSAGNVRWQIEYTWVNVNDVAPAPVIIGVTTAAAGVAWTHQMASFGAISGVGKEIGSQLAFRLFRNPTDPLDTYEHDAALLSVGIHYQVNSFGSSQISDK